MSNFRSNRFIIVGSLENEQSFAGNKVLLKTIFKGAFFSGKNRKLIFENMYLCKLADKAGVESVEPDYEVKKEFFVICVTRLDNLMVDVENTYLPLRKRFRLKKKIEKSFATGLTMTIASV